MTRMNTTRTDLGIEPDYYFTAGHFHIRASELHVHYIPDKDEARNYQHRHRDCEFQFVDNGSCGAGKFCCALAVGTATGNCAERAGSSF